MNDKKWQLMDALMDLVGTKNTYDTLSVRAERFVDLLLLLEKPQQQMSREESEAAPKTVQEMFTREYDRAEQEKCEAIWLETLEHFKAPRPSGQLTYQEKVEIAQSIKRNGCALTMAGLYGRRFEEATQTFTPAKNLGIARTFAGDNLTKFINLSAAHKAKGKKS